MSYNTLKHRILLKAVSALVIVCYIVVSTPAYGAGVYPKRDTLRPQSLASSGPSSGETSKDAPQESTKPSVQAEGMPAQPKDTQAEQRAAKIKRSFALVILLTVVGIIIFPLVSFLTRRTDAHLKNLKQDIRIVVQEKILGEKSPELELVHATRNQLLYIFSNRDYQFRHKDRTPEDVKDASMKRRIEQGHASILRDEYVIHAFTQKYKVPPSLISAILLIERVNQSLSGKLVQEFTHLRRSINRFDTEFGLRQINYDAFRRLFSGRMWPEHNGRKTEALSDREISKSLKIPVTNIKAKVLLLRELQESKYPGKEALTETELMDLARAYIAEYRDSPNSAVFAPLVNEACKYIEALGIFPTSAYERIDPNDFISPSRLLDLVTEDGVAFRQASSPAVKEGRLALVQEEFYGMQDGRIEAYLNIAQAIEKYAFTVHPIIFEALRLAENDGTSKASKAGAVGEFQVMPSYLRLINDVILGKEGRKEEIAFARSLLGKKSIPRSKLSDPAYNCRLAGVHLGLEIMYFNRTGLVEGRENIIKAALLAYSKGRGKAIEWTKTGKIGNQEAIIHRLRFLENINALHVTMDEFKAATTAKAQRAAMAKQRELELEALRFIADIKYGPTQQEKPDETEKTKPSLPKAIKVEAGADTDRHLPVEQGSIWPKLLAFFGFAALMYRTPILTKETRLTVNIRRGKKSKAAESSTEQAWKSNAGSTRNIIDISPMFPPRIDKLLIALTAAGTEDEKKVVSGQLAKALQERPSYIVELVRAIKEAQGLSEEEYLKSALDAFLNSNIILNQHEINALMDFVEIIEHEKRRKYIVILCRALESNQTATLDQRQLSILTNATTLSKDPEETKWLTLVLKQAILNSRSTKTGAEPTKAQNIALMRILKERINAADPILDPDMITRPFKLLGVSLAADEKEHLVQEFVSLLMLAIEKITERPVKMVSAGILSEILSNNEDILLTTQEEDTLRNAVGYVMNEPSPVRAKQKALLEALTQAVSNRDKDILSQQGTTAFESDQELAKLTIKIAGLDKDGLHISPAGKLAECATRYTDTSASIFTRRGKARNIKLLIDVLALGLENGLTITIEARGPHREEVVMAMLKILSPLSDSMPNKYVAEVADALEEGGTPTLVSPPELRLFIPEKADVDSMDPRTQEAIASAS